MRGRLNEGLTLYKRHSNGCGILDSSLFPEAKRSYMDCKCPIYLSGNIEGRKLNRMSRNTSDVSEAEGLRDAILRWVQGQFQMDEVKGRTIAWCVAEYLKARDTDEIAERTNG